LGPDGKKPFPGADIAVTVAGPERPDELYHPGRAGGQLLGRDRTDARGQYELSVPQTTHGYRRLSVWASAPGYAPFLRLVEPLGITDSKHEFLKDRAHQLIPAQTVRGRLLDPDGRPAKQVPLLVLGMLNEQGPIHINVIYYEPPVPLPGWPKDVITDDDGVFTLHDIGPNTKVLLQVRDEHYATNWISITAGTKEQAKPVDLKLLPARTLVGRITAKDTGKPLAGADVVVETHMPYPDPPYGAFPGSVTARTDVNGEFRVRPFPGERLEVFVYPARGEPCLPVRHYLTWPAGTKEHKFDLKVPRGIQLRGKVAEEGTDRPVGGAAVFFRWGYRNNPYRGLTGEHKDVEWWHRDSATAADGTFTITVPPGPGLLMVKAAEPGFVPVETSSRQAEGGKGGTPYFPDAFAALKLKPADAPADFSFRLRRGVVFRGQVVSGDGKPVKSALLFTTRYIPEGIEFKGRHLVVRDGRFELPGCDPAGKIPVCVYDPEKREGAFAEFDVGGGDGPTIRLSPCTAGTVRVTDKSGKPVRGANLGLHLVLRPGEDANRSADSGTPAEIDVPAESLYKEDFQPADAGDGTFPLRDLVPGATYYVRATSPRLYSERITFTAPKTGAQNLGLLTLEPPQPRKKPGTPPPVREPYIYEPRAVDPDDDPITFDLVQGPEGMTFDPQTGVLFWVPGPKQAGNHPVILRASDSYGRTAIQQFQISVSAPAGNQPRPGKQ
ncbi:MAG: hypothetical protein J2P46_16610, partial [Zavarzinella sp.]|nr:hypothetical protein [Zavarzinella sp.]